MKSTRFLKLFGTLTVCCLIFCLASADASILTFDGIGSDYFQDYGDNINSTTQGSYSYGVGTEGYTPNVVASYSATDRPMVYSVGYGDLVNVLIGGGGGSSTDIGELWIVLTADPGYLVQLYDFDMAGYFSDYDHVDSVEVLDSDGSYLYQEDNAYIDGAAPGPLHTYFDFTDSPLTDDQLTIHLDARSYGQAADQIGIDNIRFGQTLVPIPGAVWLLGSGLIALVGLRRRLKK